jgi:hypothetical protein
MSVRKALGLLFAISALLFLAACGGSSSPAVNPPPTGGFANSSLSGTYVISILGTDANASAGTESFFAIVGTITADGNGNITGGTVDINDPNIGGLFPAQAVSASTYKIGADGRGKGTLNTPEGNFALDFVLTSGGHGLITRFDSGGSGSGTLDLQTSATLGGAYTVSLAGTDGTSSFLLGSVGALNLDSSGNVTAGTMDFNEGGSSAGVLDLPLTVPGSSMTLTSATAGNAVLATTFGTLTFNMWPIDSTHFKLIETDALEVLAGDAFTQQTTLPAGTLAYTLSGSDGTGNALVAGGLMTSDGAGNITGGVEDFNDGGTASTQPTITGTCSSISAQGRCQLTFTGFSNGIANSFVFAAYPSSGGVQLLEVDSLGILQGAAFTQSATAFTASQGFGLNLTGTNGAQVDDIAEFTAGSATSSPNMTGVLDENDLGAPLGPATLSGTYTPDAPATGRGSISIPSINTGIGTLNLEYYTVDGSTAVFIDGDSSQVAVGTFLLQDVSTSGGASRAPLSMARLPIHMHTAMRIKKK